MSVYEIRKISKNSWYEDGSSVVENIYLKSSRWSDVRKWYFENINTTATLDATLYIDDVLSCPLYSFCDVMSLVPNYDGSKLSYTLKGFREANRIYEGGF